MADQQRIRVGLIGAGSVAWFQHFPTIAEDADFELVAVASRSSLSADRAAAAWGAGYSTTSWEALADHPDVDLVVIASPNALHYEQASRALAAEKHVLIEKPMASTNSEARRLAALARESALTLAVGCHMRYWKQHRDARSLIEAGTIGDVRLVRTSLHESWRLYQENIARSSYRTRSTEAVAGTMFDQATHRVDLLNYLVGSIPTRVVGLVTAGVNPELEKDLDDLGVAILEYQNGVQAVLTVDKFSPSVSNITEIYGTNGTIFASSEAINPFQSVPLAVYSDREYTMETLPRQLRDYRYPDAFWVNDLVADRLAPRWTSITPPRNEPFRDLYRDIAARIHGQPTEVLPTPEEAASVMEAVTGIMYASESRQWVQLPMDGEYRPPSIR